MLLAYLHVDRMSNGAAGELLHRARRQFDFQTFSYGAGKPHGAHAGAVARGIFGGWQIGTLFNARTGLPLDVEIVRPDIVYRNNVTGAISAAAVVTGGVVMTTPIVNVPGGGASRNVGRDALRGPSIGQAYTQSAAGGTFGALTSTVSNQVGSGTNRQFQLALRFNF